MTDVTKVGGVTPQLANRPAAPPKDAQKAAKSGGEAKAEATQSASETFRLPGTLSAGQGGEVSSEEALRAVFDSLSKAFSEAEDNPPASGAALEALLSDIKVAAPFLDRVLAARKEELNAAGDGEGLQALNAALSEAETLIADARAQLEEVAGGLPDEAVEEDPAVTAALNAILGEGREIPTFSADELREGRQEFIALVFDDIADAIGRHQNAGVQQASYTLGSLGGANLTA
jgi:hypothetical protein